MPLVEQRLDKVEQALAELAHAQLRTEMAVQSMARDTEAFKGEMREFKSEMLEFKNEMRGFKSEMLEFKNEMLGFKNEMREFKNEMREFKNEMRGFKDEMGVFKDEMLDFKEETRLDRKRMNKAWGDLANKMGTVAEDIVAPNIPRIAREEFGVIGDTDLVAGPTRVSRRGEPRRRQYDVVCAGDRKVFVVEVKNTPDREKILAFVGKLKEFDDFFPEYQGWETHGLFASWSLPEELLGFIAEQGLYGLAMGEETMDIVVRPGSSFGGLS